VDRYICIHGHFYQPPRENPWLEAIELQDSAAPDKVTQIIWGIRDFVQRFGRQPEGMWLPETAVDLETLDLLAEHDIRFTILSPYQARRVRRIDGTAADDDTPWIEVIGGRIDPSMPYTVCLPSGRTIAVLFYDGPIARAVAFEGLLNRGEALAHRLLGAFSETRAHPQLAHITTDGESYGHHHRHGDMALAYALVLPLSIVDNSIS